MVNIRCKVILMSNQTFDLSWGCDNRVVGGDGRLVICVWWWCVGGGWVAVGGGWWMVDGGGWWWVVAGGGWWMDVSDGGLSMVLYVFSWYYWSV